MKTTCVTVAFVTPRQFDEPGRSYTTYSMSFPAFFICCCVLAIGVSLLLKKR